MDTGSLYEEAPAGWAPDELIDTAELARRTGTGQSTWVKRRITGATPPFLKIGRSVRYRWGAVIDWLGRHERLSTSDARAAACGAGRQASAHHTQGRG